VCFRQCFDTFGWVTEGHPACNILSSKVLFRNTSRWREKPGEQSNSSSPGKFSVKLRLFWWSFQSQKYLIGALWCFCIFGATQIQLRTHSLTYLLTFLSDIVVCVLKMDVKLQPTNLLTYLLTHCLCCCTLFMLQVVAGLNYCIRFSASANCSTHQCQVKRNSVYIFCRVLYLMTSFRKTIQSINESSEVNQNRPVQGHKPPADQRCILY